MTTTDVQADPERARTHHPLLITIAIIISHLEAMATRLSHLVRYVLSPPARHLKRGEVCPLCSHQLGPPDRRPPRDVRRAGGEIKRLPEEVLIWRRCGGCGLHQRGAVLEGG